MFFRSFAINLEKCYCMKTRSNMVQPQFQFLDLVFWFFVYENTSPLSRVETHITRWVLCWTTYQQEIFLLFCALLCLFVLTSVRNRHEHKISLLIHGSDMHHLSMAKKTQLFLSIQKNIYIVITHKDHSFLERLVVFNKTCQFEHLPSVKVVKL